MMENEIDYIFGNTSAKELSFVPDTAHLASAGCVPLTVVKKYTDRIGFTHLKDFNTSETTILTGLVSAGREVYAKFAELGTGSVDFKGIIKTLDDAGYQGYHCIESDIAPVTNKESAKNNYNYICSL